MLFLADEDFPGIAVQWLRETGHDVLWARTSMPGQSDASLLAAAQAESRIVLTCDKDFGQLAFHWGLRATCGIVLFRLPPLSPTSFLERVMLLMASADDVGFVGTFCVVEPGRVRARPFSSGS